MSDAIKVGDRVKWGNIDIRATVLALAGKWAWILQDNYPSDDGYTSARLDTLTHIELEPVTLRARYGVGQRVQTDSLRLTVTPDNIYVVKSPAVGYELESGGWLPESLLFPIPTPCPTCKGSGKASE